MTKILLFFSIFVLTHFVGVQSRKHHLSIFEDSRNFFPISTFGFYEGGSLSFNLKNLNYDVSSESSKFIGFSIVKTLSGALNPILDNSELSCTVNPFSEFKEEEEEKESKTDILRFFLDFKNNKTKVKCSSNFQSLPIFNSIEAYKEYVRRQNGEDSLSDSKIFQNPSKRQSEKFEGCENVDIPLVKDYSDKYNHNNNSIVYKTTFIIYISQEKFEGLYSLYFHNCHSVTESLESLYKVGFTLDIDEKNGVSYLSAGEMPLPALYLLMAVVFFLSGSFWIFILRKNGTEQVFRIHWIMAALVYLKSLSLCFHGMNYHKIETNGKHLESLAILYYITHLLKGSLLFFTIVLIGSGWAFIKHVLSYKEKRVFMIVLPLQVLANVSYIIMEEGEEGDSNVSTWKNIFMVVDLLCCGSIILPVLWSIRHLQDASSSDGKATISLEKLKLFRHFYILVVSYIYFSRIVVYLLRITVPFQYEWLDEMFRELATFVFFVLTGYKFRPASNNPYFSVPTQDFEIDEVLSERHNVESSVVVNRHKGFKRTHYDETESDEGL